jgi:glycosyltransferase involved in cell wall biosynthesis
MSLLGAFIQILLPSKRKTVKYAGNWDYGSQQPWTYRMQQNILKNTFLSKKIKVLVYGDWKDATANMMSFISATYRNNERVPFITRNYSKKLKFVFTASLVVGKRPLLTIKIIEALRKKGLKAEVHMFGDGPLMEEAHMYIKENNLSDTVFMFGNQDRETVKKCLLDAHFAILPSKSEGWPKAIAEGMFFGAIPISTKISCLPWMLDYGERGILIENNLDEAVNSIINHMEKGDDFLNEMARAAMTWSQIYTLDKLDEEIGKLVVK